MIYNKEYKDKNKEKTHCSKVPAEKSIDFRPQEANNRSVYGHWEGDLVIGQKERGAVLFTLTERKKREEIIMKLPNKEAKNVAKALDILEKRYGKEFSNKFKTITLIMAGNLEIIRHWRNLVIKEKRVQEYKCIMHIHIAQKSEEVMKIIIDL